MSVRAFSYGGGVQSTAALVLAAQGKIDFRLFVFANVGDDSEHPLTIQYLAEHARPYAAAHGIELATVQKTRFKQPETLLESLERDNRSIGIPARMSKSGAPGNRSCTEEFKINPIAKWLKARGASNAKLGVIGLGISLDEYQRMRSASTIPHYTLAYPLIDLRLRRVDCLRIIAEAGLPEPARSSCWFCPYHRNATWTRMKQGEPDLFAKAVALEALLNARLRALSKDEVWLTDKLIPLDRAIGDQSNFDDLLDAGSCESGFCEVA